MRDYTNDVRPGDQWLLEQDIEPKYNILTVEEVKPINVYGICVFWDDGSWTKISCLQEKWAKPLGPRLLDWNKEDLANAILARLQPLKESGLELDNHIVIKELTTYVDAITKLAYRKGLEAALQKSQNRA